MWWREGGGRGGEAMDDRLITCMHVMFAAYGVGRGSGCSRVYVFLCASLDMCCVARARIIGYTHGYELMYRLQELLKGKTPVRRALPSTHIT